MYRAAIAFLVGPLPTPDVFARFTHLEKAFHCQITIENITKHRIADVSERLALLSLGLSTNNLCEISFLGKDAELASFVFTSYIQEHFIPIRSYPNRELPQYFSRDYPALLQGLRIAHYYFELEIKKDASKLDILAEIVAELGDKTQVVLATRGAWLDTFYAREQRSSTGIGNYIALPHIMHESLREPKLVICKLSSEVDWESRLGPVDMVIAIMMPKHSSKDEIIATVRLTRSLLDETLCSRLRGITQPEILHASLLDIMRP